MKPNLISALGLAVATAMICPSAARAAEPQLYNFSTIAGDAGYGSADGTNSAARFYTPSGVAVDGAGNVYVADTENSNIRKLTPVGTSWVSTTIAGLAGSSGSADGTNSAARFNRPYGVAVDGAGNVYMADTVNCTIRKLTPVGTNWVTSTIAGRAGVQGSANGTNSAARFNLPYGVAVDSGGNVYVADSNNGTIRKLTPVGTNWVTSTITGRRFRLPIGVAVDSAGNAYVVDAADNIIHKLTPVGTNWVTSTIAGLSGMSASADGTNSAAWFDQPSGVAVDSAGNVFVGDFGNSTVRKLTPVGTNWVTSTIAGLTKMYGSADGTNSAARFNVNSPEGVAVDSAGNVYVADSGNFAIRKLTPVGTNWVTSTIAGLSPGSADGSSSDARFFNPSSVAVDIAGSVYVADNGNSTIRKVTPGGTNWVTSTIAGLAGTYGSADGTNSDARFQNPSGVAVDGAGNVYVADTYNYTIRKLTSVGTSWVSSTIAGRAGVLGSVNGTNSDARFFNPSGVAVDSTGNVYVADTANCTIRKVTPVGTNWVSSTIAGRAGVPGSADGTNGAARFDNPSGVAVDSAGNVYVADTVNCTIRKLTPVGTNWVSSTIAGRAGVYGSADGASSAAQFSFPQGVAVDSTGDVYVADSNNNNIRKLTPVGTNWVSSTIGGLAYKYGSADGTNSVARFFHPSGVVLDSAGNVYVADAANDTIRQGIPLGVSALAPVFQTMMRTNGLITFTWSATAGRAYQVQYSSDLSSTNWQNLGNTLTATSGTMSASDVLGQNQQRFYVIVLLP